MSETFKRGFWRGFQSASVAALVAAICICAGVGLITVVDVLRGKTPAACVKGGQHG